MEASQPSTPPPEQPPQAQSTDDLLRALLAEQQAHRQEVAALRQEMNAARPAAPAPAQQLTPDELLSQRMEEIDKHAYYCPGCGMLYDYPQKCTGKNESGHQAIEVVSTDELKSGDPQAAPVTA